MVLLSFGTEILGEIQIPAESASFGQRQCDIMVKRVFTSLNKLHLELERQ